MRTTPAVSSSTALLVLGLAIAVFAASAGYAIGTRQGASTPTGDATAAPSGSGGAVPVVDPAGADPFTIHRNLLAADPTNVAAAIHLGNLLYDASRFAEAVPVYQQALRLTPGDISVSTDLGTALYYSGRPDDALQQYDVSLALDPKHAQTLFNIGTVRLEAKRDTVGAVAAWERVIAANPSGAQATKARERIDEARRQQVGFAPIPLHTSR